MKESRLFYIMDIPDWGHLGVVTINSVLVRIDVKEQLDDLHLFLNANYPGLEWSSTLRQVGIEVKRLINRPNHIFPYPYHLQGTEFQKQVWQAISQIPLGKVKTYQQIAQEINRPRAMRAVGTACGANPLPFIIPCHRVIGSQNKIGGFGLGVEFKRQLLLKEGIKELL